MRIAFTLIESSRWTGGHQYLVNLFSIVNRYHPNQITFVLFCGHDAICKDIDSFSSIPGVEVVRSSVFSAYNRSSMLYRSIFFGVDNNLEKLFYMQKIDLVFENAQYFGWRLQLPVIAWIPDLQHKKLPGYFSFFSYWKRELGFRLQIASNRLIMLSSEDARKDFEIFYPGSKKNTSVVRFSTYIPASLMVDNPHQVLNTYQLPKQFFYLPNQFWKHKNHRVVIKAVGLLKQQGVNVCVVASGNSSDPRNPEYYSQLVSEINVLGIADNFRILGLIPRLDVISLLRTCTSFINPSRFEGWSTSVEEAKSLGTLAILSDIDVHYEQMGEMAIYFPVDDYVALASILKDAILAVHAVNERATESNDFYLNQYARDFITTTKMAAPANLSD